MALFGTPKAIAEGDQLKTPTPLAGLKPPHLRGTNLRLPDLSVDQVESKKIVSYRHGAIGIGTIDNACAALVHGNAWAWFLGIGRSEQEGAAQQILGFSTSQLPSLDGIPMHFYWRECAYVATHTMLVAGLQGPVKVTQIFINSGKIAIVDNRALEAGNIDPLKLVDQLLAQPGQLQLLIFSDIGFSKVLGKRDQMATRQDPRLYIIGNVGLLLWERQTRLIDNAGIWVKENYYVAPFKRTFFVGIFASLVSDERVPHSGIGGLLHSTYLDHKNGDFQMSLDPTSFVQVWSKGSENIQRLPQAHGLSKSRRPEAWTNAFKAETSTFELDASLASQRSDFEKTLSEKIEKVRLQVAHQIARNDGPDYIYEDYSKESKITDRPGKYRPTIAQSILLSKGVQRDDGNIECVNGGQVTAIIVDREVEFSCRGLSQTDMDKIDAERRDFSLVLTPLQKLQIFRKVVTAPVTESVAKSFDELTHHQLTGRKPTKARHGQDDPGYVRIASHDEDGDFLPDPAPDRPRLTTYSEVCEKQFKSMCDDYCQERHFGEDATESDELWFARVQSCPKCHWFYQLWNLILSYKVNDKFKGQNSQFLDLRLAIKILPQTKKEGEYTQLRPIALVSAIHKILSFAIKDCLDHAVAQIDKYQSGFRKGVQSTNCAEVREHLAKGGVASHIDVEKAYDSVPYYLLELVEKMFLPPPLAKIAKWLRLNAHYLYRDPHNATKWIRRWRYKGLIQGDPAAPSFYILAEDRLILLSKLDRASLKVFVDDILTLAKLIEELLRRTRALEDALKNFGFSIKHEKTIYYGTKARTEDPEPFRGQYLGIYLGPQGELDASYNRCLWHASEMARLFNLLQMNLAQRLIAWRRYGESVLLYLAATALLPTREDQLAFWLCRQTCLGLVLNLPVPTKTLLVQVVLCLDPHGKYADKLKPEDFFNYTVKQQAIAFMTCVNNYPTAVPDFNCVGTAIASAKSLDFATDTLNSIPFKPKTRKFGFSFEAAESGQQQPLYSWDHTDAVKEGKYNTVEVIFKTKTRPLAASESRPPTASSRRSSSAISAATVSERSARRESLLESEKTLINQKQANRWPTQTVGPQPKVKSLFQSSSLEPKRESSSRGAPWWHKNLPPEPPLEDKPALQTLPTKTPTMTRNNNRVDLSTSLAQVFGFQPLPATSTATPPQSGANQGKPTYTEFTLQRCNYGPLPDPRLLPDNPDGAQGRGDGQGNGQQSPNVCFAGATSPGKYTIEDEIFTNFQEAFMTPPKRIIQTTTAPVTPPLPHPGTGHGHGGQPLPSLHHSADLRLQREPASPLWPSARDRSLPPAGSGSDRSSPLPQPQPSPANLNFNRQFSVEDLGSQSARSSSSRPGVLFKTKTSSGHLTPRS